MAVRSHTFNGVKYDIDICNRLDGTCDSPRGGRPSLRVSVPLNTQKGLITLLHECLHAEGWAKSEDVIERVSREAGTLAWRLGYRKEG